MLVTTIAVPLSAQVREPVARPAPPARPAAPSELRAIKTGADEVTLLWEPVAGVSEYHLGRHVPPFGWARVSRVPAGTTHYVDRGRDLGSRHQYSIVSVAGPMASLSVRSNEILPGDPITRVAPGETKMTPPTDTIGKGPVSAPAALPAGCSSAGGYTTCTSAQTTLGTAEATKTVGVYCPSGQHAMGGGFSSTSHLAFPKESRPATGEKVDRGGWIVTMQRIVPPASMGAPEIISNMFGALTPVDFRAYVVCAMPR